MRAPLIRLSCLLPLLIGSSASAVTIDWTPIGNPGNATDNTGYGAVGYAYSIGTYEITNAQYAEFLNAKAQSDPLGLYNTDQAIGVSAGYNGITRSGSSGAYSYAATGGRENMPVNFVSFYDALRFANWMNNGQGSADTESGAYTLLGGTATPSNGATVTRNLGATIVLTSEDEWYKAAYYDSITTSYFDYPARSNTQTTCSTPAATPNRANCDAAVADVRVRGSYTGSASPYGTFDQGGNVWEWNETFIDDNGHEQRGLRGGSFGDRPFVLAASFPITVDATGEDNTRGFRLAMIPEPGTGLLVIAGLLGLAGRRRVSA
jgi:sulfatase modifying factor 1